jgi:hypothetical protein
MLGNTVSCSTKLYSKALAVLLPPPPRTKSGGQQAGLNLGHLAAFPNASVAPTQSAEGQCVGFPSTWDCNSSPSYLSPYTVSTHTCWLDHPFSCCSLAGTLLLAPPRTFGVTLLAFVKSSFRGVKSLTIIKSEVMFHDYSFPSASRQGQPSFTHTEFTPSPYSYTPNQQPVSPNDLAALSTQFGQQSIRYDPRTANTSYSSSAQHHPSSSSAHYPVQPPQDTYACPHTYASVRAQRQAITRQQCQPSHAHEISTLVERMIASGDQCLICSPVPQQTPPLHEEDEGIYMGDADYQQSTDAQTLSYRRSSDFGATQSYVPKSIRVRKARRQKGDSSRMK